ncbi:N-terminal acetyltransferase [Bachmanniomyces sp. S44760]|nr:N-terminal acetyltransferase [Bachmanniomyces sp. S44760]
MTSLRAFRPTDLLHTGLTNLDPLTENYPLDFYLQYLSKWPSLFTVAENSSGQIIGYSESVDSSNLLISSLFMIDPPPFSFLPRPPFHPVLQSCPIDPTATSPTQATINRIPLTSVPNNPTVMGKVEEDPAYAQYSEHYLPWHGHVTALTVAPQYRRLGLAQTLTGALERGCEDQDAWFVDLFVREGNDTAINLYMGMG